MNSNFLLFFICIFHETAAFRTNETNASAEPIVQIDTIGYSVGILEKTLFASIRVPPATKELCKGRIVKFLSLSSKFIERPHGSCSYCCALIRPQEQIQLYLAKKGTAGQMGKLKLSHERGSLRSAGVKNTLPTIFYIHGFGNYGLDSFGKLVRDAYLSREEDYNFIIVDWSELSALPWYPHAVKSVQVVAKLVAKFIKFYHGTGELPISKIHLVGFSLGAQTVSFIGKRLQGKIPRITALEPSLPNFPLNDPSRRVSTTDAQYVDVIHTDAGALGTSISMGHADFYPNGGVQVQPGCELSNLIEIRAIDNFFICSHLRSILFYAESVRNPKAFPATQCGIMRNGTLKECRFSIDGYMGFAAEESHARGDFYLTTGKGKLFGKSAKEQEVDMKRVNLIL